MSAISPDNFKTASDIAFAIKHMPLDSSKPKEKLKATLTALQKAKPDRSEWRTEAGTFGHRLGELQESLEDGVAMAATTVIDGLNALIQGNGLEDKQKFDAAVATVFVQLTKEDTAIVEEKVEALAFGAAGLPEAQQRLISSTPNATSLRVFKLAENIAARTEGELANAKQRLEFLNTLAGEFDKLDEAINRSQSLGMDGGRGVA